MKPTTCKHFTGIQHGACKAGIDYDAVRNDGIMTSFRFRLPCLNPALPCVSRVLPTAEEVAEDERRWKDAIAHTGTARAAIVARHGKARRLTASMPCPVCKAGTLSYSIAGNGHIHAACSTPTCVRWME